MTTFQSVNFGHGSVSYVSELEAVPATTETKGNVTINNMGSPGRAAYCEVTYMLNSKFEADDDTYSNIFHWTLRLPADLIKSSYAEIEAEAARHIGPMLRAVADSIEQQVAEYDEKPGDKDAS